MANENRLEENSDNRPTLKARNEEINDEQKLKRDVGGGEEAKGVRTEEKERWNKWEETEKIRIMDH
jgi:hypothetical protein